MKLTVGSEGDTSVDMPESFLATHLHVMGSTGGGKSWLLMYLAWQLMLNPSRPNLIVLDPHGDLSRKLLYFCAHIGRTNPEFAKRVVVIEPGMESYSANFNPFSIAGQPAFSAALGLEACEKAWKDEQMSEKPRIARWLFNGLYAASELGLSLYDVFRLLTPEEKRARETIISCMDESFIKSDLIRFHNKKPKEQEELVEGPLNRLNRFFADQRLARMFSATTNTLDMSKLLSRGSIVLVNLEPARSQFSQEQMSMVGTLLVNSVVQAAFSRAEHERRPTYLMVDEFSRFTTRDIPYILEAGRKYNLRLVLCHQQLDQLRREDERVFDSIMANAKTKIVFGDLPMNDALALAHEFGRFDPYHVKDEIQRTFFYPHEETRTVSTSGSSRSDSRSFGEQMAEGAAFGPGGLFFDGEQVHSSVSESSTLGEMHGFSESFAEAVVPFYRLEERQEVSSRSFMSIEEQQYLAACALRYLQPQQCAVRTPDGKVVKVRVPTLRDPLLNRNAVSDLLKTIFTTHSFYAKVELTERVREHVGAGQVAELSSGTSDPYFRD